ncbi:MAG: YbhN family protein [Gemmatimonadota bacterium]
MLLSAAGLWLVSRESSSSGARLGEALAAARVAPLLAAALLGLTAPLLGGTRLWVLGRHLRPGFRWRDGFLAHLYNAFFGGLTPAGMGGGLGQYYRLRRTGLPGSQAVAILAATWVGALSGLVVMGTTAALYLLARSELFAVGGVFRGLLASILVAAAAAFLVVFFPHRVERWLLGRRPRSRLPRWRRWLARAGGRYRRSVSAFVHDGRRAWLLNAACSWLIVLVKCVAGVAVLAALGISAAPASAVARQVLQFAVIYLSPSPGGSGLAELTALGFMTGLVPPALMAAFALLWRTTTAYLAIGVGGIGVAAEQLRHHLRRRGDEPPDRFLRRAAPRPQGADDGEAGPQAARTMGS